MKLKQIYIFIIGFFITLMSVNIMSVDAGICDGLPLLNNSYCDTYNSSGDNQIRYQYGYYQKSLEASNGGNGWHGGYGAYAYEVMVGGHVVSDTFGFCLDPRKAGPTSNVTNANNEGVVYSAYNCPAGDSCGTKPVYSFARELFKGGIGDFDTQVYRIYQQYANDLQYAKTHGGDFTSARAMLLSEADVALRAVAIRNGVSSPGYDVFNDVVKYFYDNSYSDYPSSWHLTKGGPSHYAGYFGTSTFLKNAKKWFDNVKKDNFALIWNNTLELSHDDGTCDEETGECTFKFNLKVEDYLKSCNYKDVFGEGAFFKFWIEASGDSLKIIDDDTGWDITEAAIAGINYTEDSIPPSTDGVKHISVIMSQADYENMTSSGSKVNLRYETFHPMSSDNIFINNVSDSTSPTYQRMVIIKKVIHKGNIDDSANPIIPVDKFCQQDGANFYINEESVSFAEYVSTCGCDKVDTSVPDYDSLETVFDEEYDDSVFENVAVKMSLKEAYELICKDPEDTPGIDRTEVNGDLPDCNPAIESTTTSYQDLDDNGIKKNVISGGLENITDNISYMEDKYLGNSKTYCHVTCEETVDFNNLSSKFTVPAGQYYQFDTYPQTMSTKYCKVQVDYDKWLKKYNDLLSKIYYDYKDWKENEIRANNVYDTRDVCCHHDSETHECDDYGTRYYYDGEYDGFKLTSRRNTQSTLAEKEITKRGSYSDCSGNDEGYYANKASNASRKFDEDLEELQGSDGLFDELETCYQELKKDASPEDFYDFQSTLSYYYEQTLNGNKSIVRNDGRTNNVDDSLFESVRDDSLTEISEESAYITSDTHDFDVPQDGGNVETKTIENFFGSSDMIRYVKFVTNYKPTQDKYVDIYTYHIKTKNADGSVDLPNPIHIGYVFDTDVSAVEKPDNKFYYRFTQLGDENKIYQALNDIYHNAQDRLTRFCEYKIKNEQFDPNCTTPDCECVGTACSTTVLDPTYNVLFKTIAPGNIDPNDRISKSNDEKKGFYNWKDIKAQTVKEEIELRENGDTSLGLTSKRTYSPEFMEYSITLDNPKIEKIRSESSSNYADFNLKCLDETGRECISEFLTNLKNEGILTNTSGRSKWKYFDYNETTGKGEIDVVSSFSNAEYRQRLEKFQSLSSSIPELGGINP